MMNSTLGPGTITSTKAKAAKVAIVAAVGMDSDPKLTGEVSTFDNNGYHQRE